MTAWPYDVKFTVAGQEYGFMLVTPQGQSKQVNFEEVGLPDAQRVSTADIATHQDFDPRKDTPFAQSTFVGGLGYLSGEEEPVCWWASNLVLHVDGKVFLAPGATTISLPSGTDPIGGFLAWPDPSTYTQYDFCWAGPRLYRRQSDGPMLWTLVWTQPNNKPITDFRVFNGVGLIAVPSLTDANGGDYYMQANVLAPATWSPTLINSTTAFSDANGRPKYFLQVRGTCYAMVDRRKVFYTNDPTSASSWIGPIDTSISGNYAGPPGDTNFPFNRPVAVGDYLIVTKWDRSFSIDSNQDVIEVHWQWAERPSPNTFKYVATGMDRFFFSVGNEVYAYDPSTGTNMPLLLAERSGFSTKEVLGLGADNTAVYVLARVVVPTLFSGERICVLRLWPVSRSRWSVECYWDAPLVSGEAWNGLAAVPQDTGTRLYWGRVAGGAAVTYTMYIPAEADFSTRVGDTFATSGSLYTVIARSGFPGFVKRHLWLSATVDGVSVSQPNVSVSYSLDDGQTWQALTAFTQRETSVSYSNVYSKSIVLRFDFTGPGTSTPVLRGFDHHQRVRFRYLPAATLGLRIADRVETNSKGVYCEKKERLLANLVTLRTTDQQIRYEDFLGNDFFCSFDYLGIRPTRHESMVNSFEEEAVVLVARADRGQ